MQARNFPVFRDNTDSWFQIEFVMVLFNGVRTGFQWEQVKRGEVATIPGRCELAQIIILI